MLVVAMVPSTERSIDPMMTTKLMAAARMAGTAAASITDLRLSMVKKLPLTSWKPTDSTISAAIGPANCVHDDLLLISPKNVSDRASVLEFILVAASIDPSFRLLV